MCVSAILRMCKCQRLCKLFLSSSARTFQDMTFLWKLQSHTYTHIRSHTHTHLHKNDCNVQQRCCCSCNYYAILYFMYQSIIALYFFKATTATQQRRKKPLTHRLHTFRIPWVRKLKQRERESAAEIGNCRNNKTSMRLNISNKQKAHSIHVAFNYSTVLRVTHQDVEWKNASFVQHLNPHKFGSLVHINGINLE